MYLLATYILLSQASRCWAWGTLGHDTIAWIAQGVVSNDTETFVQGILDSTASDYMASVATWADSYRYTDGGGWSAPFHYIDANDSPPDSCSVNYDRDCGDEGCVVSAIVNYTDLLKSTDTSDAVKLDAMRFLIHFVGDIHQPLHDENLEEGGNGINVTFDGEDTNLHHIWDTEIPEMLADGASAEEWAKALAQISTDGWDSDLDIEDPKQTAMSWASEANAFVCSDVLKGGVEALDEGDLDGSYYKAHSEVAQEQIAKAGFRLGKWLNLVATGSLGG